MGKARRLPQILGTAEASAECPVLRERRAVLDITARRNELGWPGLREALRPTQEQLRSFVALADDAAPITPSCKPFPFKAGGQTLYSEQIAECCFVEVEFLAGGHLAYGLAPPDYSRLTLPGMGFARRPSGDAEHAVRNP